MSDEMLPKTSVEFGLRVDSWQDKETGMFIAEFAKVLESAGSRAQAIENLRLVLVAIGKRADANFV